ncbi:unnamed protein product [Alopecurus aequalis]
MIRMCYSISLLVNKEAVDALADASFSQQPKLLMEPLLLLYSSFMLLLLLPSRGLGSALQGGGLHYQLKEPALKVRTEEQSSFRTCAWTDDPFADAMQVEEERKGAATMSAVMIGSRPPRCEGRCALCGRCEAVQVPVAPRDKRAAGSQHFRLSRAFGVDESSTNYKPLNWKCRCADRRVRNP